MLRIVLFHAGIEDKLVATDGYGIVVTDEASAFFQDIKGQDNKNESNIGLISCLMGVVTKLPWHNCDRDMSPLIPLHYA